MIYVRCLVDTSSFQAEESGLEEGLGRAEPERWRISALSGAQSVKMTYRSLPMVMT